MTSPEARRESRQPSARSQRDLVGIATERLESALYRVQVGGSVDLATVDALCSIAATLIRANGTVPKPPPAILDRLDRVEQLLVGLTSELYARTDNAR